MRKGRLLVSRLSLLLALAAAVSCGRDTSTPADRVAPERADAFVKYEWHERGRTLWQTQVYENSRDSLRVSIVKGIVVRVEVGEAQKFEIDARGNACRRSIPGWSASRPLMPLDDVRNALDAQSIEYDLLDPQRLVVGDQEDLGSLFRLGILAAPWTVTLELNADGSLAAARASDARNHDIDVRVERDVPAAEVAEVVRDATAMQQRARRCE